MELGLRDQLVLVTGSTEGIGHAIAESFLKAGAVVIINGRTKQKVEDAVKALKGTHGDKVLGCTADVTSEEGVASVSEFITGTGKPLQVLVNNVGIYSSKNFFECDVSQWKHMFDVNVFSMVRLTQVFLKGMLERNSGRVINIASEAALRPLADMIHYSTSKTAVVGLSRGVAELTRGTRVTVNSVLVGTTMTPGVKEYVTKMAEKEGVSFDEMSGRFFSEFDRAFSLLQRFINPDEIGSVCVFLGSTAASCINGASIRAEGGLLGHI